MTLFHGICLFLIVYLVQLTECNDEDIVDVHKLLARMNEQEKCGQMTQVSFEAVQKDAAFLKPNENPIDMDKLRTAIKDFKVGSILNTPVGVAQSAQTWQAIIETIQDVALNETRHRIPVLYGLDSIHGANYIQEGVLFPQPLNLGSTFNTTLVERIAEITAVETRAIGIPWNFNPVLDVGRQSAWPR
jgi:beta-glucosidase